jgi:hypothetical protein
MTAHGYGQSRLGATGPRRPAAMVTGLVLNVIAALAPIADIATVDTISNHVRAAYPAWGHANVTADRNAMVIYLVVTGVLGVITWLCVIKAVVAGKRWARAAATGALVAGALLALMNLTLGGGNYAVILPTGYGVLTLLPSLAGLVAVVSLWRPGTVAS